MRIVAHTLVSLLILLAAQGRPTMGAPPTSATPADKAAETKTHALPADATATVIVFDYSGGMIQPKNNDPLMVIRADGSVTLGDRYRDNARIETRITKDDLQALLRLAIDTNDIFKINAAEIGQSIDAKVKRENEKLAAQGIRMVGPNSVADGATTVVRIHADGKDHQVSLYDLRGKSGFLRNDERLARLQNIVTRLGEVERKLRAGAAKASPEAAKEEPSVQ
ncbi:MAG TPA: hypothetical protein VMY37_26545 [Thermoguttaceae bacterium]|nr:hypothetical protein [Thermoguttaceae bacterium]